MHALCKLPLPNNILTHISDYLGGETYWDARKRLTIANAKLDLFSSQWWLQWHTFFKWYHWRKEHSNLMVDYASTKCIDNMIQKEYVPKRFHMIIQDTEVKLLLRLYKVSVSNQRMLYTLDTKLNILYNVWISNALYYRKIVFE